MIRNTLKRDNLAKNTGVLPSTLLGSKARNWQTRGKWTKQLGQHSMQNGGPALESPAASKSFHTGSLPITPTHRGTYSYI